MRLADFAPARLRSESRAVSRQDLRLMAPPAYRSAFPFDNTRVRIRLPPAVSQTNLRTWSADRSAPPDRARHYVDDVRELGKEPPYTADGPKLQHERGR